ncbi:hypothetical protein LCGC14_3122670, partial [marine sediment metagenome]
CYSLRASNRDCSNNSGREYNMEQGIVQASGQNRVRINTRSNGR